MYTVYILYSEKNNKTYVGFTKDMDKRLRQHNAKGSRLWTKRYQPWECVHTETYSTKYEAIAREQYYKTGSGREEIKRKLSGQK